MPFPFRNEASRPNPVPFVDDVATAGVNNLELLAANADDVPAAVLLAAQRRVSELQDAAEAVRSAEPITRERTLQHLERWIRADDAVRRERHELEQLATEAKTNDTARTALEAALARGRQAKPEPAIPAEVRTPRQYREFLEALGAIETGGTDASAAAADLLTERFAEIRLEAEARGLTVEPDRHEHRILNPDDAAAAERIPHLEVEDVGGLPGANEILGPLSLCKWMQWIAMDPRRAARVRPWIGEILEECANRGYVIEAGGRSGGLPRYKLRGLRALLEVPAELQPAAVAS